MKYEIYITNRGTASANDTQIIVQDNIEYNENGGLSTAPKWKQEYYGRNKNSLIATVPIHPGFCGLVASSHHWQTTNHIIEKNKTFPNIKAIGMQFYVYSKDSEPTTLQVAFDKDDFPERDFVERECKIVEEGRYVPLGEMP